MKKVILILSFAITVLNCSSQTGKNNAYLAINQIYQITKFDKNELLTLLKKFKYPKLEEVKALYDFSSIDETDKKWEVYKNFIEKVENPIKEINELYNFLQLNKSNFSAKLKEDRAILLVKFTNSKNINSLKIDSLNKEISKITSITLKNKKDSLDLQAKVVELIKEDPDAKKEKLLAEKKLFEEKKLEIEQEFARLSDKQKELEFAAGKIIGKEKETKLISNNKTSETLVKVSYNIANNTETYSAKSGFDFPSQTQIIDALAIFIAKRMKQQAISLFFTELTKKFDNNKDLQDIFPETYDALKINNEDRIPSLGGVWRTSFSRDIINLPKNITTVENKNAIDKDLVDFYTEITKVSSLYINNYNPIEILYNRVDNGAINTDFNNFITFILIINENLADYKGVGSWVKYSELTKLKNNDWERLMILLYTSEKKLFDELNISLIKNNSFDKEMFKKIKPLIGNVLMAFNSFDKINKNSEFIIRTENKVSFEKQNIKAFFNIFIAVAELLENFTEEDNSEKIKKFKKFFEETKTIYNAILDQNYQVVVLSTLNIYKNFYENKESKDSSISNNNNDNNKDVKLIYEISSLLLDILNCKDSRQLEEVISSHALPPNSFTTKRNYHRSVEITTQPGFFLGGEVRATEFDSLGTAIGFTAPIGIAFNWPAKKKEGCSNSVFLSLLDIGAVVSYRLTNDAEGLPEEVTFSQFIGLGLFYIRGLKDRPLSILFGAQLSPRLRSFDKPEGFEDMMRFSLGVSFDIPLFRLYSKKEK